MVVVVVEGRRGKNGTHKAAHKHSVEEAAKRPMQRFNPFYQEWSR